MTPAMRQGDKADFSAVMGHRIINDLTLILGSAETLLNRSLEPPDRSALLHVIDRHVASLEGSAVVLLEYGSEALGELSSAIGSAATLTVAAFRRGDEAAVKKLLPVLESLLEREVDALHRLLEPHESSVFPSALGLEDIPLGYRGVCPRDAGCAPLGAQGASGHGAVDD